MEIIKGLERLKEYCNANDTCVGCELVDYDPYNDDNVCTLQKLMNCFRGKPKYWDLERAERFIGDKNV